MLDRVNNTTQRGIKPATQGWRLKM